MGRGNGMTGEGLTLPLDVSHDPLLVAASFAIAFMAGFTGLFLTRGAQALAPGPRKRVVATAAVILGGGIWSMHFVAMLGLQMPVPFYYDALTTLISALIGILLVGLGLLILHFRARTPAAITAAGLVFGTGILAMHYVGMSGMQACRPAYAPAGLAATGALSLALATAAIWVAYGARTRRNIALGTVGFALAVVSVHYLAMAGTDFFVEADSRMPNLALGNEALAFAVTLAAFAICGGFLLSGVTVLPGAPAEPVPAAGAPLQPETDAEAPLPRPPEGGGARPVPYERNGRTYFAAPQAIAAFRAEGHYTVIYHAGGDGEGRSFCPWSISEAGRRLDGTPFIRAHRSYLINPTHVSGFERKRDTGVAYFEGVTALGKVPVSRSRLPEVRAALGL